MHPITRTALLAAAAALGAGTAFAAPPAAEFVAKAGASDMYETQSSKLVLQTTKNPGIRTYANNMIKDHGKSTADVKAAARKSGMKPKPPMLEPKQQQMISELTAAKGPARDSVYVNQQKMAHQEALALHSDYAATGDDPNLKMAAGKIAPVVQHHVDMLNAMPAM